MEIVVGGCIVLLLVPLLRVAIAGLWNVIGGLGMLPGELPLRHAVQRAGRLWVYQLCTHSSLWTAEVSK